ncbi:MAG: nickel pincer cofactor biosynthesis protein LarB [Coriobacteriales bacterium]|nr:nickel pincer cofactor biosynthesis protein LarB [Coriobacteriales bacterium]
MEQHDIREFLQQVAQGTLPVEAAYERLSQRPSADLGYANVDLDRSSRQGVSEVIYGAGKTSQQIAGIVTTLVEHNQSRILITRLDEQKAQEVKVLLAEKLPADAGFTYHADAHMGTVGSPAPADGLGTVLVLCAGTSDIPVAEEAALTAEMLGNHVERIYDVGVAGIHRLLSRNASIANAQVIVAVAGMEGALASVVGGLARCPVIAVPTSVGYGTSFGGLTALFAMLNSCASGVSVVNIDNGFGAGFQASLINHPVIKPAPSKE